MIQSDQSERKVKKSQVLQEQSDLLSYLYICHASVRRRNLSKNLCSLSGLLWFSNKKVNLLLSPSSSQLKGISLWYVCLISVLSYLYCQLNRRRSSGRTLLRLSGLLLLSVSSKLTKSVAGNTLIKVQRTVNLIIKLKQGLTCDSTRSFVLISFICLRIFL